MFDRFFWLFISIELHIFVFAMMNRDRLFDLGDS